MMRKKQKQILIAVLVIVGLIIILAVTGKLPFAVGSFTPIYCNDYSFTCCIEDVTASYSKTITDEIYFQCPSTASKCEITYGSISNSLADWYTGSSGCTMKSFLYIDDYWSCTNEARGQKIVIAPNEFLWVGIPGSRYSNINANINVKVYSNKLVFCGRAGCTTGVPVSGANACTFNPSATYKDGNLVDYEVSATSYTVNKGQCLLTFVPGDRHICGNVEEQCFSNSDCGGHTYGNFECIGRTLQEYGCRRFSTPSYLETYSSGYAYKPFQGDNDGSEADISRCEIISSRGVQCCGDTDCGSNAFCDKNTWTCKETAECNNNYDCGVSIQCDINTKQLKQPVCSLGKCIYNVLQNVDCCSDSDCAVGYFCSNEYTCLQEIPTKTSCPFECCENEQAYFDRPCPSNKPYCVNNVCEAENIPENKCASCDAYAISSIIGGIWKEKQCEPTIGQKATGLFIFTPCIFSFIKLGLIPIIFIFSLLYLKDILSSFNALKRKEWLAWIFSVTISLILALFVFKAFWIVLFLFIGVMVLRLFVPRFRRRR